MSHGSVIQRKMSATSVSNIRPDDWRAFAMEMWGICIASWKPLDERAAKLPEPLEYDVLQIGLVELNQGQRHTVLQAVSCYQVDLSVFWFLFSLTYTTFPFSGGQTLVSRLVGVDPEFQIQKHDIFQHI